MNHQSMPIFFSHPHALAVANAMASRTGRRWRVRQSGPVSHLWLVHEVDQPVVVRKEGE